MHKPNYNWKCLELEKGYSNEAYFSIQKKKKDAYFSTLVVSHQLIIWLFTDFVNENLLKYIWLYQ